VVHKRPFVAVEIVSSSVVNGPATRSILQRELQDYAKPEYQRLAFISVAQLYNLRHQQRYRERHLNYTKTRPTAVSIGER
jgi:hypothetical protein